MLYRQTAVKFCRTSAVEYLLHGEMMDKSDASLEAPESQWCLVGNIVDERPYGEGGTETRPGTKHFSDGTKVYCLPAQWGDGYDQIIVIGRHRGSKQFKTMIVSSDWITNWRAKVVYNPDVLRRIKMATSESWKRNWQSQEDVELYVKSISEYRSKRDAM